MKVTMEIGTEAVAFYEDGIRTAEENLEIPATFLKEPYDNVRSIMKQAGTISGDLLLFIRFSLLS